MIAPESPTWDELVKVEPRLANVESQVKLWRRKRHKLGAWYGAGGFKEQFSRLVGWLAEKKELRTMKAYDAAYVHLGRLLGIMR